MILEVEYETNQTHFIRQDAWLMIPPIVGEPIKSINLSTP